MADELSVIIYAQAGLVARKGSQVARASPDFSDDEDFRVIFNSRKLYFLKTLKERVLFSF